MRLGRGFAAILAVLAVTLLTVSLVGYYGFSPGKTSSTASTTQTSITTGSITSRPLPCSAPGVQCGSLDVSSISLTAVSSPHQNSTLTAVVVNTGNVDIWQVMFYLNGTLVDTLHGIPIGNTVTYNVPIPPSFSMVSGHTYKVDVDSTILLSGGRTEDGGAKEMFVTAHFTNPNNNITVTGLGLCSSNCIYPSPHASATVMINAVVPISTLVVYVNNTYDGTPIMNPSTTTIACTTSPGQNCSVQLGGSGYSNTTFSTVTKYYATCSVPLNATTCLATSTGSVNTLTAYAFLYKGSLPNQFIPAVKGAIYVFKFVATFQDGSTATSSASTVAD